MSLSWGKYNQGVCMKKSESINSFALLAAAIAGIVGSGWLLGPLVCARIAGPASILSWVIAGLLMMVVAATFVKLSRAIPTVGGTVRFFQMSYGHFAGFSFSWIAWLAWIAVAPIETMALIQYSTNYLPFLMTKGASPVLTADGVGVAIALLVLINLINSFGVRIFSKVNFVVLAFKIVIPITTIILLLHGHFKESNLTAAGGFMPAGWRSVFAALPLAGVIYSFIGFNPAIQMAAEAKNPKRAVPIAIFGALSFCIVLYALIQLAFVGAIPAASLSGGWSKLHFAGDTGPIAGLFMAFGLTMFVKALYADAVVSPFGTAMVQAMATSRLTVGMSKNGYFPKGLMHFSKTGSPIPALVLNMVVGFIFFLPFPSWQRMVGFLVSCLAMGYIVGPMSLMILSRTQPEKFGEQSVWRTHVLCFIALYICSLIIYWAGWDVIQKLAIVFALGYVVLAVMLMVSKRSRETMRELNVVRGFWVIVYMLGLTFISHLSTFGGIKAISFGYDFLVMLVFTFCIYILANGLAICTQPPSAHA
jgi:amino acid transporter